MKKMLILAVSILIICFQTASTGKGGIVLLASTIGPVDSGDAMAFALWLTDPDKGQKIIKTFGADKYGQALFIPESKAYQKNQ